jgi:hypothetical protein
MLFEKKFRIPIVQLTGEEDKFRKIPREIVTKNFPNSAAVQTMYIHTVSKCKIDKIKKDNKLHPCLKKEKTSQIQESHEHQIG